jgi:hypothetical protein
MKSLIAWFTGLFTKKEPVMADTPEVTTAPATTTDTELLKALLVALGHDVEAKWDNLVALAQKAV